MKKKIGILCACTGALIACSLVVAALSNKASSLIDTIIGQSKRTPENTFVIDDHTEFTPVSTYYQAIAMSSHSETVITTKFEGFNKVADNLVLPANTIGVISTTDPINLGFQGINIQLTLGSGISAQYHGLVFFSYNPITLDNIASGKYSDLISLCNTYAYGYETISDSLNTTTYGALTANLPNCRYMLMAIWAEEDLTLGSVSYQTPCIENATGSDDLGTRSSYRTGEESFRDYFAGESLPFIGHGAYTVYGEDHIKGAFLTEAKKNAFCNALVAAGFTNTLESGYAHAYQKKINSGTPEEVVRSVLISSDYSGLYPFEIMLTTSYPYFETYSSWPETGVSETFSSEYASLINAYPFYDSEVNVNYQLNSYSETDRNHLSIMVSGFSGDDYDTPLEVIENFFEPVVLEFISHNTTWTLITNGNKADLSEGYSVYLADPNNIHTIQAGYMPDYGYMINYSEIILLDDFPTAQIETQLGQSGIIIPYNGPGKFRYSGGNSVTVYNASQTDLEAYRDLLISSGLSCYDTGYNYQFGRSVFNPVSISISYNSFAMNATFSISYNLSSEPMGMNCASLEDALNKGGYEEMVINHTYPTITGEHEYVLLPYSFNGNRKGIYISDLSDGYVTELLEDGTFNTFFNGYLFEHDGNDYLLINAKVVYGGIWLDAQVVNINDANLKTAAQINELIDNEFAGHYDHLNDPETLELYNNKMSGKVHFDESSASEIYYFSGGGDYVSVKIYGDNAENLANAYIAAATATGHFEDSIFNRGCFNSASGTLITNEGTDTNSFGTTYCKIGIYFDKPNIEFVAHENADLSAIETDFAVLPSTLNRKEFIHYTDSFSEANDEIENVIVRDGFDDETFYSSLMTNGFTCMSYNYYVKQSGNKFYSVEISNHCYDSDYWFEYDTGYLKLQFRTRTDYYQTLQSIVTANSESLPTYLKNDLAQLYSGNPCFHLETNVEGCFSVEVSPLVNLDDYIETLTNVVGYVGTDGNYYHGTDSYRLECHTFDYSSSRGFNFYYGALNWTSRPNPCAHELDMFYYQMQDYLPFPSETGNIYDNFSVSHHSLSFWLKKSVDIDAYIDGLKAFGYNEGKDDSVLADLTYDDGERMIGCTIRDRGSYFEVCFESHNMGNSHFDLGDFDVALSCRGWNDTDIFSGTLVMPAYGCFISYDEWAEDPYYHIGVNGIDNIDDVRTAVSATYQQDLENENRYTKIDANYRYVIDFGAESIDIFVYQLNP